MSLYVERTTHTPSCPYRHLSPSSLIPAVLFELHTHNLHSQALERLRLKEQQSTKKARGSTLAEILEELQGMYRYTSTETQPHTHTYSHPPTPCICSLMKSTSNDTYTHIYAHTHTHMRRRAWPCPSCSALGPTSVAYG